MRPTFFALRHALALALTLAGAALASGPLPGDDELRFAVAMLTDVAIRNDVRGLELARERLAGQVREGDEPARAGRVQYLLGLADWRLAQARALATDLEGAKAAALRGRDALVAAFRLDPSLGAAPATLTQVYRTLSQVGGLAPGELGAAYRQAMADARAAAPDDPVVVLVEAAALAFSPPTAGGDLAKGLARFDTAIAELDRDAVDDPLAALFLDTAWTWRGGALVGAGRVEEARRAFETVLERRPDNWMVRDGMLPMTELAEPGDLPATASVSWSSLVTDPSGDGRFPGWPDLVELSWSDDREHDRLLFRFALAGELDPASVGLNLVFDSDHDPATGTAWWGGNTAFQWDRLVTLWVVRGEDGRYRGTDGIGDPAGVARGRFTGLARGSVAFRIDPERRELVVGFPRRDLGASGPMRLLGVVGSATSWNDVAPAEGSCEITLAP